MSRGNKGKRRLNTEIPNLLTSQRAGRKLILGHVLFVGLEVSINNTQSSIDFLPAL